MVFEFCFVARFRGIFEFWGKSSLKCPVSG